MIDCIFTIDYEIYGNGEGSLNELVFEPTRRLMDLFQERNATFVAFAEAIEFRKIEEFGTDEGIGNVKNQLRDLFDRGFEIGLHLHPWWSNARHENDGWHLDWTARNLCTLSAERIDEVVGGAVEYLRRAMGVPLYAPESFRGGLWLMQPTTTMARVLAGHGIRIDSSVFKGGWIRDLGLDFRPSLKNGYHWRFGEDVNLPDPGGALLELPIYTDMVPFWKMIKGKRIGLQRKVPSGKNGTPLTRRFADFARFRYPRKLDFCRMDYAEMRTVMDAVIEEDQKSPEEFKPIVAIGHSKDLVEFESIRLFLSYLDRKGIAVSSLRDVFRKLKPKGAQVATGCRA
jgi:hypothetical protein